VAGAIVAFALNWVWENAQAPLFRGYAGFARDVGMCTRAALGDVLMVAAVWTAVAAAWRDPAWHRRASIGHLLAAAGAGFVLAVGFEYWALATGRWAYDGMPLLPATHIGLTPTLQMAVIPPIVFALLPRRRLVDSAQR
jgi:hypothetical protein